MIYFLAIIPVTDMSSTPSSRRGLAIQSRLVSQVAEAGIACLDTGYNRVLLMARLRQTGEIPDVRAGPLVRWLLYWGCVNS